MPCNCANLGPANSPRELAEWLVQTENRFGGIQKGIPRKTVSPLDPRSPQELMRGGMIGGDRMSVLGYAPSYAEHLAPFVQSGKRMVLVEAGILRGTGLALWSDLFPNGRIIGLDIDLSHIRLNLPELKSRGAFRGGEPELYEFDQFVDESEKVRTLLGGDRIDVYIDDGFHSDHSILQSFASVQPFLAKRCVCFIEDNANVWWMLQERYPQYTAHRRGLLTILVPSPWWLRAKRRIGSCLRRTFGKASTQA